MSDLAIIEQCKRLAEIPYAHRRDAGDAWVVCDDPAQMSRVIGLLVALGYRMWSDLTPGRPRISVVPHDELGLGEIA